MFKINRIYESYKKGYAFKCLYALFWPVCPALIGRVARTLPLRSWTYRPKYGIESFKLILNTYLWSFDVFDSRYIADSKTGLLSAKI